MNGTTIKKGTYLGEDQSDKHGTRGMSTRETELIWPKIFANISFPGSWSSPPGKCFQDSSSSYINQQGCNEKKLLTEHMNVRKID